MAVQGEGVQMANQQQAEIGFAQPAHAAFLLQVSLATRFPGKTSASPFRVALPAAFAPAHGGINKASRNIGCTDTTLATYDIDTEFII
jgi:hypothetical protein